MKLLLQRFLFAIFLLSSSLIYSQYEFFKPDWYGTNGFKKLYVKVGDQNAEYTKKIMKLFQDNWDVCPVEFFSDKIDKTLFVDGNLFMNFERYTIASQYVRDFEARGSYSRSDVSYNDYYFFNFWVIDKKYKPKYDWWDYKYTVAKSEFYLKTIGMGEEEYKAFQMELIIGKRPSVFSIEREEFYPKIYDFTDADFQNYFLNGTAGNIKNMIQYVNAEIKKGTKRELFDNFKIDTEMQKLKTATLYFPNSWYGEKGTIMENLPKEHKYYGMTVNYLDNLIKAYPYKMQLIKRSELNDMILKADKDFYYLNYIQSSADKLISIINGKTGEVIYSEATKNSYRIKEKDIDRIAKAFK
ncbi:MAG TPA: hypothetical protein PKN96_07470 [Flavobacterium sp.]|uniref:hypothetical protein n=1 Tax=Flavobacterium sp. TaxID=239 RepID=UPI002C6D7E7A|nr:hypothetical protein [Flavobacterium sp.]HNP33116.1 hypothetical protein [Flavobacterium sp.]